MVHVIDGAADSAPQNFLVPKWRVCASKNPTDGLLAPRIRDKSCVPACSVSDTHCASTQSRLQTAHHPLKTMRFRNS